MKRLPRSYVLIAVAIGVCAAGVALGNPTGATIVSGQVSFNPTGNVLQITNRPGAIINWQGFSIGANEVTRFIQQSSSSAVLNRVTGAEPSTIFGNLQSNGRVLLVNPSGNSSGSTTTSPDSNVVAPGKTIELSDPKSPNIKVEVKAPANRAVNVQQLVDSIGKRDVTSTLMTNTGARSATMVVRDDAGRLMLKAAP